MLTLFTIDLPCQFAVKSFQSRGFQKSRGEWARLMNRHALDGGSLTIATLFFTL